VSAQRIRTRFRKGERVRYISHLDVLRHWERAIRRAGLPLSYSRGFTPHPKLAFASPLPLGFAGEREIMDVLLDERVDPADFEVRLTAESTAELAIVAAREVPLGAPPPQAAMLWSDYRVAVPALQPALACERVEAFLATSTLAWREQRGEREREYDLRAATAWVTVRPIDGGAELAMRLKTDQHITARPEAILAALVPGFEPQCFTRTDIILDERSPGRELWRRHGQYL
jgi:radical SAM-linked protein